MTTPNASSGGCWLDPQGRGTTSHEKLAARGTYSAGTGELSADSTFLALVKVWLEDLDLEDRIAVSTRDLYERDMRTFVMPAFEHFTLREISISKINRFLKGQAKINYSGPSTPNWYSTSPWVLGCATRPSTATRSWGLTYRESSLGHANSGWKVVT